jgi:6,7-dimethyl-8-ribityllumazine synthase
MKKEHLDMVWDSCSEFERANITFSEFLEKLGKALESANVHEAKFIGEITRSLEFAMVSGSYEEMRKILEGTKKKVAVQIRSVDD